MSAVDFEKHYNDFLEELLDEKKLDPIVILTLTPCWPSETIFKGSIKSQTAIKFMIRIYEEESVDIAPEVLCALYTRCKDTQDVLDLMESTGLNNSAGYFIFEALRSTEVQNGDITDAMELFAIDKEPWVCSFLASVCQISLTQHFMHKFFDGTNCSLKHHLVREYISLLLTLFPANNDDIRSLYKKVCDFDLSGPKLSAVGDTGELFPIHLQYILLQEHFSKFNKMHELITAKRCTSEYAKILWKPFYAFGIPEQTYVLLQKVSAIPLYIDMETDEREDCCEICYDAVTNVRFDDCLHTVCSQCAYTLLNKNHALRCPFCRVEVTNVTEFDPPSS